MAVWIGGNSLKGILLQPNHSPGYPPRRLIRQALPTLPCPELFLPNARGLPNSSPALPSPALSRLHSLHRPTLGGFCGLLAAGSGRHGKATQGSCTPVSYPASGPAGQLASCSTETQCRVHFTPLGSMVGFSTGRCMVWIERVTGDKQLTGAC